MQEEKKKSQSRRRQSIPTAQGIATGKKGVVRIGIPHSKRKIYTSLERRTLVHSKSVPSLDANLELERSL